MFFVVSIILVLFGKGLGQMSGVVILLSFLVVFLLAAFLFSHLKINIYGYVENTDFCGHIDFEICGLKLFTIKLGKKRKNGYSVFKNRKKFYKSLSKYTVNLLEVNGEIGLGDAAVTAITVGGFYSVLSLLYSLVFNQIKFERLNLNLKPDFGGVSFFMEVLCIIDVKVVNIIIDVIKIWVDYTREKFDRREEESLLWQNIR